MQGDFVVGMCMCMRRNSIVCVIDNLELVFPVFRFV